MTAVQVGFDVLEINIGDKVVVEAHDHEAADGQWIPRAYGWYIVQHIFQNGNLWAEPLDRPGQGMVILQRHVLRRYA